MKKNLKRAIKKVKMMTDPDPKFVSLVDHGANQTPFNVVKRDDEAMVNLMKVNSMSIKLEGDGVITVKGEALQGVVVTKYVFKGDKYPDEASVISYLEEAGYSDVEVTKLEEGFEVVYASSEDVGEESAIEVSEGLTVYVSPVLTESDDKGETKAAALNPDTDKKVEGEGIEEKVETQEPATEKMVTPFTEIMESAAQKYNTYSAIYESGGAKTIAGVMQAGADGIPPAFFDVMDAYTTATRTAILAKDMTAVKALGMELGDFTVRLVAAFDTATFPPEIAEKLMDGSFSEKEKEGSKKEEGSDTDEGNTTESKKKEEDERLDDANKAQVDASQKVMADLATSIQSIAEVMCSMKKEMTKAQEVQKEAMAELNKEISDQAKKVAEFESRSQSSKVRDVEEGITTTPVVTAKDDKLVRNTLGFMAQR